MWKVVFIYALLLLAEFAECGKSKSKNSKKGSKKDGDETSVHDGDACHYRAFYQSFVPEPYLKYIAKFSKENNFIDIQDGKYQLNFPFFKDGQAKLIMEELFGGLEYDEVECNEYNLIEAVMLTAIELEDKKFAMVCSADKNGIEKEFKNLINNQPENNFKDNFKADIKSIYKNTCTVDSDKNLGEDLKDLAKELTKQSGNWEGIKIVCNKKDYFIKESLKPEIEEEGERTGETSLHDYLHDPNNRDECPDD